MKFLTLLLLFCITLEIREIPKYGSISFFGTQYIYLNLDGFKSGDNVSFHLNCTNPKYSIQYGESNSFTDSDFRNYSFSSLSSFNRVSNYDNTINTNDFTINVTGKYKYLLLRVIANNNWFTIVNKKNRYDSKNEAYKIQIYASKNETYKNQTDSSDKEKKSQSDSDAGMNIKVTKVYNSFLILMIIIFSFVVFIVIVIISAIIYCVCNSRSVPNYACRIDSPLVPSYPGVQSQPQPTISQPCYQPYVVQPGKP